MSFTPYSSTTLSASTTVENFEHIREGSLFPMEGGSLNYTTSALDLGSSTYVWNKFYVDSINSSVTVTAPINFAVGATFQTQTSFAGGGGFPQHMICHWIFETSTADAYEASFPFNTVSSKTIPQATLSAGQITLPAGSYVCSAQGSPIFTFSGGFHNFIIALNDLDSGDDLCRGNSDRASVLCMFNSQPFTISTTTTMELVYRAGTSTARASIQNDPGNKEATIAIFKVS